MLLICCFLLLAMGSCRHKKELNSTPSAENKTSSFAEKMGVSKKEIRQNKLYSFINEWYGTPYKYGGCKKSGVDCSCFTGMTYESVYGVKLGRTAGEIHKSCEKIKTSQLREGDLVFFITNGKNVSHVGIYLKNGKFAHASTSKGVIVSALEESYYKKNFHSAGRLRESLSWKD